jgi:hypothetical protein
MIGYKWNITYITLKILFLIAQNMFKFKFSQHYLFPVATHGHDPSDVEDPPIVAGSTYPNIDEF